MNQNIKDLSLKAAYSVDLDDPKFLQKYSQKFAKLIINECISLMKAEKTYYDNPGTYEPESYYIRMEAKAAAFDDAIRIIKNHFGVEE